MTLPNLAAFSEAQNRLRTQTGTDVTFRVPITATWPEGTKINPTTGEPYDALAKRENAGYSEVVKRVGLILKQASPLRPQSDTEVVAAGELSGMDMIVDISEADYADVEDAVAMVVNGLDYEIREAKPFSIGSVIYRRLIYGEQR